MTLKVVFFTAVALHDRSPKRPEKPQKFHLMSFWFLLNHWLSMYYMVYLRHEEQSSSLLLRFSFYGLYQPLAQSISWNGSVDRSYLKRRSGRR